MADAAAADGKGKGKIGRRKLVLAAPVLLLIVGAGLWATGILPHLLGRAPAQLASNETPPVFVDLPEIVANLDSSTRQPAFIKLSARLELTRAADQAAVTAAMPRILDLFQTYLRETRPEELRGSAGTYRLREELIARASLAATPARIVDVLFTQVLVQ